MNEVNPIDVEALKEFLGPEEHGPIEYEPNYRLVLDGNRSTQPPSTKVQKVFKSSTGHWITCHINLSDYEAISITLSWLWDQLWDNGKNLVSVSGAYYDDDGERSLYCCTVKNHDKIESPGIHTTGKSPLGVMIKAYEQYKELVK